MSRVLLTGFEPFGSSTLNPSQEIIRGIGQVAGLEIVTAILPVVFDQASAQALSLVREVQPEAVVALGQAEGRTAVSIERFAVNLIDARLADNAGVQIRDGVIAPDGPTAYESTLPMHAMASAIEQVGVPAEISLTAGAFLCNHVFYSLQHALRGTKIQSGFIHVPLMAEQAAEFPGLATVSLADQIRAIRAALSVFAPAL